VRAECEKEALRVALSLDEADLFGSLSPEQRQRIAATAEIREYRPGALILAEGVVPERLFLVLEGEVAVAKGGDSDGASHRIRTLGPGETFGELSLLEAQPTSASISAALATRTAEIPIDWLRGLPTEDAGFEVMFRDLAMQLNRRLRFLTEVTVRSLEREVEALQARVGIGILAVGSMVFMSVFVSLLNFATDELHAGSRGLVVAALSLLGLGFVAAIVALTRQPAAAWGLTTANWRRACRSGLLTALALLVPIVGAKWLLIQEGGLLAGQPLLNALHGPGASGTNGGPDLVSTLVVYTLLIVPVQEFAIRGCAQGMLERFLPGSHRVFWAIVASNLIFASIHAVQSPIFVVATLVPGFAWGWLYARERTLIAPLLSHAVVGAITLDIIGFPGLLTPVGA